MCGVNFFRYMKNLSTGQRRRFPLTNPLDWLRAAPNKRAMLEDALGEILERPTHSCLHIGHEDEPLERLTHSCLHAAHEGEPLDDQGYMESPLTQAIHAATQVANPDRLHINAMWEEILLHYFRPSTYAVEPCWHGVDPAVVDDDRDLMVSLLERDGNGGNGGGGSGRPDEMVVFTLQPRHDSWKDAAAHLLWSMGDVWESACNPDSEQNTLYGIIVIGLRCQMFSLSRGTSNRRGPLTAFLTSEPLHVRADSKKLDAVMRLMVTRIERDNF
ncbi:hypothetical protein N3K66_000931 [Trichothecium roseum]|uniref:Uncharacterized protein n=1 Tax=Trichothecium roseum TaxID=47278 RepID=A0ACC0VET6_9HYPO|nr:hypothetical protein N3K66_000931 [Trichothecium roseum]